jgi:hypothetical protein
MGLGVSRRSNTRRNREQEYWGLSREFVSVQCVDAFFVLFVLSVFLWAMDVVGCGWMRLDDLKKNKCVQ